jgi:hypothetical protein
MQGEVYDIRSKRRRITLAEYIGMLDTLQKYFVEARRLRGDSIYRKSETLLHEIRWNARFSAKFRENSHDTLKTILDEVYEDIVE